MRQIRQVWDWFDPSDGAELTLTFLLCLPFLILIGPPLVAAQVAGGDYFLPLSVAGWVTLPYLSWASADRAYRRSGRTSRTGFGSILLWLGMSYAFTPVLMLVAYLFWASQDYAWMAGTSLVALFLIRVTAGKVRDYAQAAPAGP